MAQHSISFYEDVVVKIYFRNVSRKNYNDIIDYLTQSKPKLTVRGKLEARETEWSQEYSHIVGYTTFDIEPVVTIRFRDDYGETVVAHVQSDDKEALMALTCAGMNFAVIDSYEVFGDKSKMFARLMFREAG